MKTITQLVTVVTVVSCLLTLSGCSSDAPLDVGDDQSGTGAQGLAAYEGDWDGYAEAYSFPSGSDRVRLSLDAAGHGTLEVGDISHFACTDPTVGCPPALGENLEFHAFGTQEGFEYAVDASLQNDRLQFEYWGTDAQKTWCEAQTSEPNAAGGSGYTCSPLGNGGRMMGGACFARGEAQIPIACSVIDTCWGACTCDASGCTSNHGSALRLDGALSDGGAALVGTLMVSDARVTVRLKKP